MMFNIFAGFRGHLPTSDIYALMANHYLLSIARTSYLISNAQLTFGDPNVIASALGTFSCAVSTRSLIHYLRAKLGWMRQSNFSLTGRISAQPWARAGSGTPVGTIFAFFCVESFWVMTSARAIIAILSAR